MQVQLEWQSGQGPSQVSLGVLGGFGAPAQRVRTPPTSLLLADPLDACDILLDIAPGAVVLAERGNCSFVDKALNVQKAGGSAMMLFNNASGEWDACICVHPGYAHTPAAVPHVSLQHLVRQVHCKGATAGAHPTLSTRRSLVLHLLPNAPHTIAAFMHSCCTSCTHAHIRKTTCTWMPSGCSCHPADPPCHPPQAA
jgi:hypothetical protein